MNGKDQRFEQVYDQSKDKIYRLCLGFTGNTSDAEDLFQEILIKVWNNLDGFKDESNVNTWVYRVATNTALTFITKQTRAREQNSNLAIIDLRSAASENSPPYNEEKVQRLYQAISTLKEIDKIIISLVLDECSYIEIAEITGISKSNVGVKINRIKKSLAKKLN